MSMEILYETLHCLFCGWLVFQLAAKAVKRPGASRLHAMTGAAACLFLGDLYWLTHLLVRGSVPQLFSACDVSYLGTWLMLGAGLPRTEKQGRRNLPMAALMGTFAVLNGIGWGVWTGYWFSDILWMIPMAMLMARSALLLEAELRTGAGALFCAVLAALTACEAAVLCLGLESKLAALACDALWLLSLAQLARVVKGGQAWSRLTFPAWLQLILYAEFAALLSSGWAYFLFQVLVICGLGYMALGICKEGEAADAV